MSSYQYQPEALKRAQQVKRDALGAVYDYYLERARACLLWNMSPAYYDSMTDVELTAWVEAWNELQREAER